jgi:hypothetical protein
MSWVTVSPGGWKNGSWNSTIDDALIPSP